MTEKGYRYAYRVLIDEGTRPALASVAEELGFINDVPGGFFGKPSPAALLDAIAAAYGQDPAAVTSALRSLGIEGAGRPEGAEGNGSGG